MTVFLISTNTFLYIYIYIKYSGNVLEMKNMVDLLELVNEYKIPIISDEIYASLVYNNNNKYISFSKLKRLPKYKNQFGHIPILRCSGAAKQYLIPGWYAYFVCFVAIFNYFVCFLFCRFRALHEICKQKTYKIIENLQQNRQNIYYILL